MPTHPRVPGSIVSRTELVLQRVAEEFAAAIPAVDARMAHDRWKPGIGPFEEELQLEALREATEQSRSWQLDSEVPYSANGQRCDLVIRDGQFTVPIEAKLARFRYDNGSIDPQGYARLFTPFPEEGSSSLLTDAQKLTQSEFDDTGGLLAIFYEQSDEPYDLMSADRIAKKVAEDIEFWFEVNSNVAAVAEFEGLRHPHHERGAVITWTLSQ